MKSFPEELFVVWTKKVLWLTSATDAVFRRSHDRRKLWPSNFDEFSFSGQFNAQSLFNFLQFFRLLSQRQEVRKNQDFFALIQSLELFAMVNERKKFFEKIRNFNVRLERTVEWSARRTALAKEKIVSQHTGRRIYFKFPWMTWNQHRAGETNRSQRTSKLIEFRK